MTGRHRRNRPQDATAPIDNSQPHETDGPQFAQPQPSEDPTRFVVKHAPDGTAYREIDALARAHELKPLAFPAARGGTEPVLTLEDIYGRTGTDIVRGITHAGQIVFHSVGDTGNTRSTESQNLVTDKLVSDFSESYKKDVPYFMLHLGDVIYSFGEAKYYYDQFYDPYRDYPAPIISLAGNHDGMVAPGVTVPTLQAFLENFCATRFEVTPDAGGLDRTAQIQPGVYYTFEAPFVRILVLYSNTLEDPGVISSENGSFPELSDVQLDFLEAALKRVKSEKYDGALIIAHHHPIYTAGSQHGWSPSMQAQIDKICGDVDVWPHAVLSGHAHNYQRFTRKLKTMQIPYLIAGGGGHALAKLRKKGALPLRVPDVIEGDPSSGDGVTLESYDDLHYGYLRIVAWSNILRIEYHPANDGREAKTPDDYVTVDLKTRKLIHYVAHK
ncbi:MAG: metallophosphoesterase [Pseudomonadota bacterium]